MKSEYVIEVIATVDDIPVRGNAVASGNEAEDKRVEDEIIARLDKGDVWAWASVEVRVTFRGVLTASEYLGGCCYEDEADFVENSGYYEEMVDRCKDTIEVQRQAVR